ncbi:MAG: 4Fe-4S binding protein [Clostridia bacterium]
MAYFINKEDCIGCGACESDCPVSCISEDADGKREIEASDCISCGACADNCPVACISEQ